MPLFIASPTEIYQGQDAIDKLAQTNDSRFVSADGIIQVDLDRWQQAQAYERATWMETGLSMTDDRADHHRAAFNGYAALPADLGRVLELGCGVFTITNTILQAGHTAQHITLVDPLIDAYKGHPYCTYRDGTMQGVEVTVYSEPIEGIFFGQQYNTVIMVNVLSHCRDARVVLDLALRAVAPGGILVFQETVHNFDPLDVWDAGHPLRPTQSFLDAFTSQLEAVYKGDDNYFVGRKTGVSAKPPALVKLLEHEPTFKEPMLEPEPPAPAKKKPARKSKGK